MLRNVDEEILPGLHPEAIEVGVHASDWREAVLAAGDLLSRLGIAEPRYGPAMVATAERLGPYIVVAPGLAIPHSRPEDGALRSGLCLITLKEPVCFGNAANDPVRVVVAIASADANSHVEALAELAPVLQRIYQSPGGIDRLAAAPQREEALKILQEVGEDPNQKGAK